MRKSVFATNGYLYRRLRDITFLRSAWLFMVDLYRIALNPPSAIRKRSDKLFEQRADPWQYTKPLERRRMDDALAMLDAAKRDGRFRRAIEIGCAEGFFTALLAPRCESLLALDISSVALERASSRCRGLCHVRFMRRDVMRDPLAGEFDLVIVMGVLEYYSRPWDVAKAARRIIDLTAPGGYLLVSSTRKDAFSEGSWWRKHLIGGGKWTCAAVARDPRVEIVSTLSGELWVHWMLRRSPSGSHWQQA
jgi:SAM-dependent methyltransferase